MSKIKAVFFDIDGTLVGFKDKAISDKTIHALDELRQNGIHLFIATGRPKFLVNNLKDYPFDGYITMNGAYVTYKDNVVWQKPVDERLANILATTAQQNKLPCVAFLADRFCLNYENKATDEVNALLKIYNIPREDVEEVTKNNPVYQYSLYITVEEQEKYYSQLNNYIDWQRWHPSMVDAIPKTTSKALGIEKIIKYLNITTDECLSFGDGGNDLYMLKATGVSVAMGNAVDHVKQVATFVTDTAENHGVVKALRQLGLIKNII